jgi:hypothetical protein
MIVARAPRRQRILYSVLPLPFLLLLVFFVWGSPLEVALVFGVFFGAGLLLELWLLAAGLAVYEADEFGLRRRGWRGVSAVRWDEIGRYRVRTSARELTYVLYDHQGRRRTGIDFQILAEGGEPLFELVMRKLPEVLPGQEHARPELPHLRRRRGGALPEDPAQRALALRRRARAGLRLTLVVAAIGLTVGSLGGWLLWTQARLVREGRMASAVVTRVASSPPDRVWYTFATPDGQTHAGHDTLQLHQAQALHAGNAIRVRYLPERPQVNGALLGMRRSAHTRLGRTWLFHAPLYLAIALFFWLRRVGYLRQLRALESGAGASGG